MANKFSQTISFKGEFDISQITKGLQDIKKQVTNANIGEELKKQFETAFNKLQINIPALEKLTSKEDFNLKDIQALQKLLKDVTKDWENLNKVTDQIDLSKTFSAKDLEKINNLDKQIKQTRDNIQKARKELVDTFTNETKISVANKNVSDALTELFTVNPAEIDSKFQEIQDQFSQGVQQTQIELQNKLENANIQKTGKSVIDYFFGENSGVEFANKVGPVKDQINEIIRKYREFKEANNEAKMAEQIQKLNEVLTNTANFKFPEGYKLFGLPTQEDLNVLNEIGGTLGKVKELAEGKEVFFTEEDARLVELFKQKLETENQAAINCTNAQEELTQSINDVSIAFVNASGQVDYLNEEYQKADIQAKALEATFGGLTRRIASSVSALTVFNKSIQIIHRAIDSVKELDAAFTQIAIVSEQSNEEAWKMFDSFNKLAKQYSITTRDLTEGAKLFYQQGLNASDTMKMVEASTVSAALGEVSMAEAANTLTAAIQGYNESAAVAMDYTDKIAMVGAVSAADFNELSAAMEKTASSAYTAGIDFDHLLGYLGKMIEVTREAPANLGTAMKTIIARFEDMKKDPLAILEDGATANKVEAALATIGIALRDTAGEFRPLQEVFDELGMKWQSLTRNQQAYIATVAAGSRQQSRFLAMMNNYDRTLELITESQNSAGAAAQQYATFQDSAAAASARLTAAWEEFYSKVASPERITNAINLLTKLVEVMNKVGPTWSALIATVGAHSINKAIKGSGLGISLLKTLTSTTVKSIDNKQVSFTLANTFLTGVKEGLQKTKEEIGKSGIKKTIEQQVTDGTKEGIKKGLLKSASLGNVIGSAIGPVLIGTLIAAIIAGVGVAIAKAITFAEEKEQRWLRENSERIRKDREKVDEYKKEKRAIEDNYEIYKKYNKQIVLTEDELKEQNEAVENIQEEYNRLIVVTDELGKKNIVNTEELENHTKELKKQTLELEKQIALKKYDATKASNAQITKYGENNNEYKKDWSVTQLTNVGYTQEEAEILDLYGEMFRNQTNKNTGIGFKYTPGSYSLKDRLITEYEQNGGNKNNEYVDILSDKYIDDLLSDSPEKISKMLQEIDLDYNNTTEDIKIFYDIIKKYGENAIEALEILETRSGNYAKTLMNLNLENIDNSSLQNDLSNLINNLDNFNNGAFFNQFNEDNVEKRAEEINDAINNFVSGLDVVEQKSFHNLAQKMLDPSLSTKEKHNLIKKFKIDGQELSGEMREIMENFAEGSNNEIARRKKMSDYFQAYGITEEDLKEYNSVQLRILDQFKNSNKNEKFDWSFFDTNQLGANLLKQLSTLEKDLTSDPTIYKEAQDTMVKFFTSNFELDPITAFNTFQEMFGNLPEIAVQAAKDRFLSAKENLSLEPTESLSDDQITELESSLGESLRYYIEINEEGEKYLTVAGKIAVFDKESEKYRNALIAETNNYISQMDQITAIATDQEKQTVNYTEEQAKQIKNLERDVELNTKKLERLKEIQKYTAQTTAATSNIDRADSYHNNLKTFKQAEDEIKKLNGVMRNETAKTIMGMDASYTQFLQKKYIGEEAYYTISAENLDTIRKKEKQNYNEWLEGQRKKLDDQINILTAELEYFQSVVDAEGVLSEEQTQKEFDDKVKALDGKLEKAETELEGEVELEEDKNKEILIGAKDTATQFHAMWSASYSALRTEWNELADAMANNRSTDSKESPKLQMPEIHEAPTNSDLTTPDKPIGSIGKSKAEEISRKKPETQEEKNKKIAQEQVDRIKATLERLQLARDELVPLGPELEEISSGTGKTSDELEKLTDTIKDLADALEDLDDLLIEINRDLKDISVDYNPFTDLFEAWEHEWDYYYNIKRLIAQIGQQGQFIDNVISADYVSADAKVNAYHAKIGNVLAKMSANDAYIEALRAGMSQTAVELTEQYGQYYKVDPTTGQIYQTDKNLTDINDKINAARQEVYDLQKLQNEKENDLALENAKLDALEQEKSAYESILSTIESQLSSLEDNEDIIVDLGALKGEQASLKAKIEVSDESIEAAKDRIRSMEDEIQEIEVQITLDERTVSELEGYVDKMEDKVSEYEEYWETLNGTIAEQQELLQELYEIQQTYIDTAINTQQQLYDAIVEQYQDEINEKKKQYDYLKQLDNEYLQSVKESIDKERQLREDSNKQKSYQQNLQRAQLLQMDTSGTYRTELANLKKDIEAQRQDLYDDLVDKQVKALEKEIEKRHELYDKEVAALEERLAYYQENAILLWEMVNSIVSEGAEAMMATLENTTAYINSNELSKQQQRLAWANNVQMTLDGVKNGTIDTLNGLITAGNDYINNKLPEIGNSLDEYSTEFTNASDYINSTTQRTGEVFQGILDSFMSTWNQRTNEFTGYAKNWTDITASLKAQTEKNLTDLTGLNERIITQGDTTIGSIGAFGEKVEKINQEMYDDFINERQRYRDELNGLIDSIRTQIGDAVTAAADAIKNAVAGLQSGVGNPQNPDNTHGKGYGGEAPGGSNNLGGENNEIHYYIRWWDSNGGLHTLGSGANWDRQTVDAAFSDPMSYGMSREDYLEWLSRRGSEYIKYKMGGIADFTGPAWLDGTKSQPEAVLDAKQTKLFTSMVNSLEKASNNSNINSALGSSYNIGDINTNINVERLDNETDIDKVARQVENRIMKSIRNRVSMAVA